MSETFNNGSTWSMCWDFANDEGIYLTDITYTPPNSDEPFRVINEVSIAQIFVPYDDNNARYHDVTTYDFGGSIERLRKDTCTGGKLYDIALRNRDVKNALCQNLISDNSLSNVLNKDVSNQYMLIFSSHQVGLYNYMPEWKFYSNGMIDIGLGATGALQEIVSLQTPQQEEAYQKMGWIVGNKRSGVSHVHNYFWRIDFALGQVAKDDVIQVVEYKKEGTQYTPQWRRLTKETKMKNNESKMRAWRVQESQGNDRGYMLVPGDSGHNFKGKDSEQFTKNDFYVTQRKGCERYATQNRRCDGKKQVSDFVQKNKTIKNKDVVVWYSLSLHHIPRAEEVPEMDMHKNSFRLLPHNLY